MVAKVINHIILKGNHIYIYMYHFPESNWPFSGFFRIFFIEFLSFFLITVAAMLHGGSGHQL